MAERRCTLTGEIDLARLPELRAELRRLIVGSNAHLLIDCVRMKFIDSAGVAALLEAHAMLAEHGRHLLIANVRPRVRRTFELLGVGDLLTYDRVPSQCLRGNGRPLRAPVL
jgi:anti-sigma B factor antagonist